MDYIIIGLLVVLIILTVISLFKPKYILYNITLKL